MNKNGIFCAAVLLAFAGIQIALLEAENSAAAEIQSAAGTAFETERLNLARTAVENSMDALISETMRGQLLLNSDSEKIKKAVNEKIAAFLQSSQAAYAPEIKIEFKTAAGAPSEEFLNQNSAIIVEAVGAKTIMCEYSFTGGVLKNNRLWAEISGAKTKTQFMLPIGYSIAATAVK